MINLGMGVGASSIGAAQSALLGGSGGMAARLSRGVLDGSIKKKKSKTPYSDMLTDIQQEQQAEYDTTYRPLAQKFIADVNSTGLIDSAKASASVDKTAATQARGARQVARLGVTGTPGDEAQRTYDAQLGSAVTNDGNINKARADQQTRNDAVRSEVINIGRGIAQNSMSSAISAAGAETNRNNTNASLDAQNKAARNSTMGSLAGIALMMMM